MVEGLSNLGVILKGGRSGIRDFSQFVGGSLIYKKGNFRFVVIVYYYICVNYNILESLGFVIGSNTFYVGAYDRTIKISRGFSDPVIYLPEKVPGSKSGNTQELTIRLSSNQ